MFLGLPVPEFIDPVFTKTSPKRSFSLNRKRAYWLVFAKTGSIISGSDPFPSLFVRIRIRILPSNKKVWKNLIYTISWLLFDFLSVKNDINVPSKNNKQKTSCKNFVLSASCQLRTKKSRIRVRNRIRKSVERISWSGSVPKCYGSTTLLL